MSKEMIISSSAHETRVAILEDDQVAEIFIERERSRGVVGNVYKGRVSKVLPGMQSAFVDLGLERDGFLYVTDVVAAFEELDRFETEEDEQAQASAGQGSGNGGSAGGQRRDRPSSHGGRRDREREKGPEPKIEELLKEGQEIIVQVAKEPLGHQGRPPDLSRHHARALPGLHADRRSRRRLAKDRVARRALPPARHRPRVPRADRLRRRPDHPHGRSRSTQGRHRLRPELLPSRVDRHPPEGGDLARAGRRLPGAEPGGEAAARPADRRLPGDPDRQRSRTPARDRADRADHAVARVEGEAVREGVSRSSRSTASRRRSTARCAARSG